VECYYRTLEEAIGEGSVIEETINEAVRRILKVKKRMNLFEEPYIKDTDYSVEKHRESAKECAKEAMVLLKNDNNSLPLLKSEKIGVVGNFAQDKRSMLGTWALDFDLNESVAVYDGIKASGETVMYFDFVNFDSWEYVELLKCDTLVVVLGESDTLTGENKNIADIEIDDYNKSIIKFAKKTGKRFRRFYSFILLHR